MAPDVGGLLREFKRGLEALYGPRLRAVYLFGSYARNKAGKESDVDVLIVLDQVPHYGTEVDRTGDLTSRLSLEYGVTLSRVFVSEDAWRTMDCPFVNSVRPEAVPM